MRTRLVFIVGAALIAGGAALLPASGQTAQKAAASMVVYKAQT